MIDGSGYYHIKREVSASLFFVILVLIIFYMEKPLSIKNLEILLNVELKPINHIYSYYNHRGYQIAEGNIVVGLHLNNLELVDLAFLLEFKELQYLNLSNNLIEKIDIINELKNIERLYLGRNRITNINNLKIRNLKVINIYSNNIESINFENEITYLKEFNVSFNAVKKFNFKNMPNLRNLDLDYNNIEAFEKIDLGENLEILNLNDNEANIEDFGAFRNLKELRLYGNELKNVDKLSKLTKIKFLDLRNNKIENADALSSLENLNYLGLSYNSLTNIEFVQNFEHITELDIRFNKITKLPYFYKLKNLVTLNLENNLIEDDLRKIDNLEKLKFVFLSHNSFISIPELKLKSLKKLYLYSNKISFIESYVPNLNYYYHEDNRFNGVLLGNNPLDNSLIEILKLTNSDNKRKSLNDYFSNLELGAAPLLEAKLMILGEGESGKTNLRNYIIEKKFQVGKSATTGINIDTWKQTIVDKEYRINIWDFGGQWIQQQVHQFFLTNESLYIVFLNARQDEKPEKWLDWIKNYTKDSKVFVVANKMDENPNFSLQENLLRTEYPFIVGFHYISLYKASECKDGFEKNKVEKLLLDVKTQITNLKNINALVPKNYHALKNDLEDNFFTDAHSISFDIFKNNLFDKHKIIGSPEILLNLLEKIGTIRFFKYFDKVILSPEWLSDGVYKILMSEVASENNGVLDEEIIKKIIITDSEEKFSYRESDIPFIKKLMEDFKLAYIKDGKYFIPSQFQTDLPIQIKLEEIEEDYNFKFYFEFDTYFPEILISKFIVDFFEKVYENDFWKTGILIKDVDKDLMSETYAFIISREKERRIFFHLKGDNIRSLFREIHQNILKYLEKTDYRFKEFIVYKNKNLSLNYRNLIVLYQNGIVYKQEVTENEVININVKETLGLINNDKELEKLKKENDILKKKTVNIEKVIMGNELNFKDPKFGDFNQIGTESSSQNNYINNYNDSSQVDEAKQIVEEFKLLLKDNEEFKQIFMDGFEDLVLLQESQNIVDEKEAKSRLISFYEVAKEFVTAKNILTLPVEIHEKGEKLLHLLQKVF